MQGMTARIADFCDSGKHKAIGLTIQSILNNPCLSIRAEIPKKAVHHQCPTQIYQAGSS
jgi:hypothetical protein